MAGFGKRTGRTRELQPRSEPGKVRAVSNLEPEGGFFSTTPGLIIGAVALGVAGYFGAAAAAGRLGEQFAWFTAMLPARSAPAPKLDDALIRQRLAACMPQQSSDAGARETQRSLDEWRGNLWTINENDPKSWIPAYAIPEYLRCAGTTERRRFCKSSYRAQFASQVSRYYSYLSSMGADSPFAGQAIRMQSMLTEDGDRNPSLRHSGISTGQSNPITQSPLIVNTIRQLSRDGLLNASDFGWFGPPEAVKPFLEKEPHPTGGFCL